MRMQLPRTPYDAIPHLEPTHRIMNQWCSGTHATDSSEVIGLDLLAITRFPNCLFGMALMVLSLHCSWIASGIAWGEVPTVAVDAIYPPVLTTVQPNTLKISAGRFTQDIDELIFSNPMIRGTVEPGTNLALDSEPQKQFGSFKVTVDPSVPEGYYEVWAVGRYGISNSRTIAIIHTPIEVLPTNTDPKNPPEIKPGVCYVGQTRRNDRQTLRVASTSTWPRVVVAAESLDSIAMPTMTVLDAKGKMLQQLRGSRNSPILFTKPATTQASSGESLTLKLYDFLYRGGDSFFFAIVVDPPDSHPLLTPSSLKSVSTIAMEGLSAWPTVDLKPTPGVHALVAPAPPWETRLQILPSQKTTAVEFTPVEGQAYECEVFSEVLDQASDIRAVVDRPPALPTAEQLVAIDAALKNPSAPHSDAALQQLIQSHQVRERTTGREIVTVAEDSPTSGTRAVRFSSADPIAILPASPAGKNLRITLTDLNLQPSSPIGTHVVLRVGPPTPRMHAIAFWTPDTNNAAQAKTTGALLSRGGQIAMHISIRRNGGFAGPVSIVAQSLPAGVTVSPAIIAPGQTETQLVFYAAEDAPASTGTIVPVAKIAIDGNDFAIPIQATTISVNASGDRGLPQSRRSKELLLRVNDRDMAPIQIRIGDGQVLDVAQGASLKLPIKAIRRAGGEAKCVLRPQNLPPKTTLGEFELAPNALEATPELKVAADAPVGEYTLWFQGEITIKQSLHPESHARTVAYRDRLQSMLADPSWSGDRPAAEKLIGETNTRIEALAKEIAPRDFPTFLTCAPVRIRIVAPPEAPQ